MLEDPAIPREIPRVPETDDEFLPEEEAPAPGKLPVKERKHKASRERGRVRASNHENVRTSGKLKESLWE